MHKLTLLAGAAIGYVLGSRAGRERYEKLKAQAVHLAQDPKVQSQARHVADVVKEQAPAVKDKVTGAVSHVRGQGSGGSHAGSAATDQMPADDVTVATSDTELLDGSQR